MADSQHSRRLAQWVARWNGQLTRFLGRRLHSQVDAEDLAQEVYLRLLRIEHLEEIEQLQAYVYQVARNIAAEWSARAQQTYPHSSEELDALIELTTPESLVGEAIESRQLDLALQELRVTSRAAVYLKLRDGKTHEEIAAHLGVSPRMVRKYLTEGYADLRSRLVKE